MGNTGGNRVRLDNDAYPFPHPVTLVGTMVDGAPNFATIAWMTPCGSKPPMLAFDLDKTRYTTRGIYETKAFSVNIPGADLVAKTDHCGLFSGKSDDKARLFTVVEGEETGAPLIEECPVCMECRLVQVVDLPTDEVFFGEIVGVYAHEACLTDGKIDPKKAEPFVVTLSDEKYWGLGECLGTGWSIGQSIDRVRRCTEEEG